MREELQANVLNKNASETADWLNALLFEILCTRKSRRLIDADKEALLSALTRISREAVESKLSDYQKDSWLFLSSLNLESFSFGDRLPLIQAVRIAYSKACSLAIVIDISYVGGIKVGLKAAMAMNLRDFAASINFTPSKFKFIMKMDAEPTPRISFMLSDVPAYEMAVTMRSQQMDRVSNILKLIIGNFVRNRLCFPNYLTVLFRSLKTQNPDNPFAHISNSKQYQSQLRIRLVSVSLNFSAGILDVLIPTEQLNVMAVLSLGDLSCKTEVINADFIDTRWNSIHTFNIFNGLETSPKCLQISLYQVIDANGSLNHLGRVELPYPSITPGLLDIRTLPISTDPTSFFSLEMYLHHMEEDGEKDAAWIFWNCPRPSKRRPEQEMTIEEVNWDTIKFIISKLSASTADLHIDDSFDDISNDEYEYSQPGNNNLANCTKTHEKLFEIIQKTLTKAINRLLKYDPFSHSIDVLTALRLELEDFALKFNLARPPLSSQALPAHNERLITLLHPLMKSFVPEALELLKDQQNVVIGKVQRDLKLILDLVTASKIVEIPNNDSSPDLGYETEETKNSINEFFGLWGDVPVIILVDSQTGITIKTSAKKHSELFDFEGIFYLPNERVKSFNLASSDLFNSSSFTSTWEVVLLRDRFLSFIPLGQSHLFPHRVIDVHDIIEVEIIKDRDAFSLGFNADLSEKETMHHANNGLLRLTLKDSERIDLLGESRSCDQWYCILSCRLDKKNGNSNNAQDSCITIPWKDISKIWLLPLNIPSLNCPYAIAIRQGSQTFVILNCDQIYRAYCCIKTIWLGKVELLGFNFLQRPVINSSTSSLTASPQSQKSSLLSLSIKSFASSSTSTSLSTSSTDPFSSKTRFDRLKMSIASTESANGSSSLVMTSIDDLKKPSISACQLISDNSAVFNCTLGNFPSGFISIGSEFICYWPQRMRNLHGLSRQPQNILILPRAAILDISKSTPNWVSSFSGIVLKLKRHVCRSNEPLFLTGFNNSQELELVFDNLSGL